MLIFGGHAARLRGQPFARADSDIDMFASQAELDQLTTSIAVEHPAMAMRVLQVGWPQRHVILAVRREAPEDWRTIEIEVVQGVFADLIEALPKTGTTALYGVPCDVSDLVTDCLIKQAALDAVPNCDPKHAQDLADLGFSMDQAEAPHLAFYAAWQGLLLGRYQPQ